MREVKGFDQNAFIAAHHRPSVTSVRLNAGKGYSGDGLALASPVPWCLNAYYLDERPSFTMDPLFHAGCYYVQEASSMFVAQAMMQSVDLSKPLRVLDLCAAPGGKSTLVQSMLSSTSLLVSNEVIRTRVNILEENLVKWGGGNTIITSSDPSRFSGLEQYFDVIICDAPCSGSGLIRRDADAASQWSEDHVALCSQRQQRIIADAWPSLKSAGVLIYSTCSYSTAEDEDIADWIAQSFNTESIGIKLNESWGIVESQSAASNISGYRFFPDKVKGEGFYLTAMRKCGETMQERKRPDRLTVGMPSSTEKRIISEWLRPDHDLAFFKHDNSLFGIPPELLPEIATVQAAGLYVKRAGIRIGQFAGNELIPAHDLAMSRYLGNHVQRLSLSNVDAIKYLQKEAITPDTANKGWTLTTYEGYNLGWAKMLGNRINNYYPKQWKIRRAG